MPRYLFTARDAEGRIRQEAVDAPSAAAALARLEGQGLRELELVSSNALTPPVRLPSRDLVVFASASGQGGRVWAALIVVLRRAWWVSAVGLGLELALRWRQVPMSLADFLAVSLVVSPILVAVSGQRSGPPAAFRQLLELMTQARWEEALACLPRLERVFDPMTTGLHRARCLAGLGRVDEAYRLAEGLRPQEDTAQLPYLALLAPVYGTAHDFDRQLAVQGEALALAADKAVFQLDVALTLALRKRDVVGARRYLEASAGGVLPKYAATARSLTAAVIACEEGHLDEALRLAAEARLSHSRCQRGERPHFKAATGFLVGEDCTRDAQLVVVSVWPEVRARRILQLKGRSSRWPKRRHDDALLFRERLENVEGAPLCVDDNRSPDFAVEPLFRFLHQLHQPRREWRRAALH